MFLKTLVTLLPALFAFHFRLRSFKFSKRSFKTFPNIRRDKRNVIESTILQARMKGSKIRRNKSIYRTIH